MEELSLKNVLDKMDELMKNAYEYADRLEEQKELTLKYSTRCRHLAKQLKQLRALLVDAYGTDAKHKPTQSLIKRVLNEKNEYELKLREIALEIQNDENIQKTAEGNPEYAKKIEDLLQSMINQSEAGQVSDYARLLTIKGQGQAIRHLHDENRKIQAENIELQTRLARMERALEEEKENSERHIEFLVRKSELADEVHGWEIEDLQRIIEDLEGKLKAQESLKFPRNIKKIFNKILSFFKRGKQPESEEEPSERI